MIRSVLCSYRDSKLITLLKMNVRTGEVVLDTIDPTDVETLVSIQDELKMGYIFSDYGINEGGRTLEFVHSCNTISPGVPKIETHRITQKLSFTALMKFMVANAGKIVTSLREGILYDYEVSNISSLTPTDALGLNITHLLPAEGQPEDNPKVWRFNTGSILRTNFKDEYKDVTNFKFLLGDVPLGEFDEYLNYNGKVVVLSEKGTPYEYNSYSVKPTLPLFSLLAQVLTSSQIVGILQYISDAYKCAIRTLSEGLFDEKEIEYSGGSGYYGSDATGRSLKIKRNAAVDKKAATAMNDYLFDSLSKKSGILDRDTFTRQYPHYPLYESIVKKEIVNMTGAVPFEKKMEAYARLKNTECYVNLSLLESKWQIMFDNGGELFRMWARSGELPVNIPHYKMSVSGGGGTWRTSNLFS